jgi:hypothetical protein
MLRGGSLLGNSFVANSLHSMSLLPSHETLQVITVGTIAAESLFIEKTFDTTTHADLVGIIFGPDRPAHLAMPAAPKDEYRSPRQASSYKAKWPHPT